jgi:GDPmannose 4,6-dehydratase
MTEKRALICGVSGQDGAYLAQLLLDKGYRVFGTSRDAATNPFNNLSRLGIAEAVQTVSASLLDFRSVIQSIKRIQPTEIYNLSGQSSVGLSFEQPSETFDSVSVATLNLLEAIRLLDPTIRLYNASSSECFGNTEHPADESTPMRPRSPYAVAKAAAFWQVANYREGYQLYCASGILFNHESSLRPARFVVQKIVSAVRRIAAGEEESLVLGNLAVVRDWGWAPEYVEAMWAMLQVETPDDFVIATGQSFSLQALVEQAFSAAGLDWQKHVHVSENLFRPTDLLCSTADPAKAKRLLGWQARCTMPEVIRKMLACELH